MILIKVCMVGLGKTGSVIAKNLLKSKDLKLVMALCSPGSEKEGKDLGELLNTRDTGILVMGSDKLSDNLKLYKPDVAVDFSTPDACVHNMEVFAKHKVNMVIGTTGFTKSQEQRIESIVKQYKIGVVMAPNITLGVNVVKFVSELVSSLLFDYDVEISEAHHRNKKDSPSGTAIKIADSILKARKIKERNFIYDRSMVHKREDNEIGISSIRAGGIVGVHKVIFAGENDMVELTHQSFSREAFAEGAKKAIRFIAGKKGMYDMDDVLNLKTVLQNYLMEDYAII